MEFLCSTGLKRPVRLSEATRRFAWDSLHGKYGDDTMKIMSVEVDAAPEIGRASCRERV